MVYGIITSGHFGGNFEAFWEVKFVVLKSFDPFKWAVNGKCQRIWNNGTIILLAIPSQFYCIECTTRSCFQHEFGQLNEYY